MHLNLVLLKHIFTVLDSLVGLVTSADVVSEEEEMGLNVVVDVDVVDKVHLEEFIYSVPVLVTFNRKLK